MYYGKKYGEPISSNKKIAMLNRDAEGILYTCFGWGKDGLRDPSFSDYFILRRTSTDGAVTWSAPVVAAQLPYDEHTYFTASTFRSRSGNDHYFTLRFLELNEHESKYRGDIMYTRVDNESRTVTTSKVDCLDYYTGAQNSIIQLHSGRILVPFSPAIYYENQTYPVFECCSIYSDDDGVSWHASNFVALRDDGELTEKGAIEPVVVELSSDRILMIIRTTTRRFYYSISEDGGATWGEIMPSGFKSDNSPAGILRMPGGELLLTWNNCLGMRYVNGVSYARQVLHAAVSTDNGVTWKGYRPIASIPEGIEPTALYSYPFLANLDNDHAVVACGLVASFNSFADPTCYFTRVDIHKLALDEEDVDLADACFLKARYGDVDSFEPVSDRSLACDENEELALSVLNVPMAAQGEMILSVEHMVGDVSFMLSEFYIDPVNHIDDSESNLENYPSLIDDCCVFHPTIDSAQSGKIVFSWNASAGTCTMTLPDGQIETERMDETRYIPMDGISYLTILVRNNGAAKVNALYARVITPAGGQFGAL